MTYRLEWRRVSKQRTDLHTSGLARHWPGRGAPCTLREPCDEWIVAGGRGWILVLRAGGAP